MIEFLQQQPIEHYIIAHFVLGAILLFTIYMENKNTQSLSLIEGIVLSFAPILSLVVAILMVWGYIIILIERHKLYETMDDWFNGRK